MTSRRSFVLSAGATLCAMPDLVVRFGRGGKLPQLQRRPVQAVLV
jgi:hypothetical protein